MDLSGTGMSVLLTVVVILFLVGQGYLYYRRRKVRKLFRRIRQHLGSGGPGRRLTLIEGAHRVVLDANVSSEKGPEELRLEIQSDLPGDFRLTLNTAADHYEDCRHRKPASPGEPFPGWHIRSEDPELLEALWQEPRFREALDALGASHFSRIELARTKLRASWPEIPWEVDKHDWHGGRALPDRLRAAAVNLSNLATATNAVMQVLGREPSGARARALLAALLLFPLFCMVAGALAAAVHLYSAYTPLEDGRLLALTLVAAAALTTPYTWLGYLLLKRSIIRGRRTALVGCVAFLGFFAASPAAILWWNGTGTQGPGQRLTVEVISVQRHSALESGRGAILRALIEEASFLEEWLTTHRAIVRSWRDPASVYALQLTPEQYKELSAPGSRLSMTVFPGALRMKWYRGVGPG